MDYTEEELLAFIARNDEHKTYYENQLAELMGRVVSPDLDAIEARELRATEGSWEADDRETLAEVIQRFEGCDSPDYLLADRLLKEGFRRLTVTPEMIGAVPALVAEVRRLRAQVERGRELHAPMDLGSRRYCAGCWDIAAADYPMGNHDEYPCPTIRALDEEDSK